MIYLLYRNFSLRLVFFADFPKFLSAGIIRADTTERGDRRRLGKGRWVEQDSGSSGSGGPCGYYRDWVSNKESGGLNMLIWNTDAPTDLDLANLKELRRTYHAAVSARIRSLEKALARCKPGQYLRGGDQSGGDKIEHFAGLVADAKVDLIDLERAMQ